ncbi:hypothetical protein C8R45DRAFT_922858 [Mycena sanguinolenta]|nr:hypothetical protein C8R45DRAFT_922858 [Mycena sanguinolenta]
MCRSSMLQSISTASLEDTVVLPSVKHMYGLVLRLRDSTDDPDGWRLAAGVRSKQRRVRRCGTSQTAALWSTLCEGKLQNLHVHGSVFIRVSAVPTPASRQSVSRCEFGLGTQCHGGQGRKVASITMLAFLGGEGAVHADALGVDWWGAEVPLDGFLTAGLAIGTMWILWANAQGINDKSERLSQVNVAGLEIPAAQMLQPLLPGNSYLPYVDRRGHASAHSPLSHTASRRSLAASRNQHYEFLRARGRGQWRYGCVPRDALDVFPPEEASDVEIGAEKSWRSLDGLYWLECFAVSSQSTLSPLLRALVGWCWAGVKIRDFIKCHILAPNMSSTDSPDAGASQPSRKSRWNPFKSRSSKSDSKLVPMKPDGNTTNNYIFGGQGGIGGGGGVQGQGGSGGIGEGPVLRYHIKTEHLTMNTVHTSSAVVQGSQALNHCPPSSPIFHGRQAILDSMA